MGLESIELPGDVASVRTTPRFTTESVPAGLLAAHRLAAGVWGVLRVHQGTVAFVLEQSQDRRELGIGEQQVIRPEGLHHVEPGPGAAFDVEMFR